MKEKALLTRYSLVLPSHSLVFFPSCYVPRKNLSFLPHFPFLLGAHSPTGAVTLHFQKRKGPAEANTAARLSPRGRCRWNWRRSRRAPPEPADGPSVRGRLDNGEVGLRSCWKNRFRWHRKPGGDRFGDVLTDRQFSRVRKVISAPSRSPDPPGLM